MDQVVATKFQYMLEKWCYREPSLDVDCFWKQEHRVKNGPRENNNVSAWTQLSLAMAWSWLFLKALASNLVFSMLPFSKWSTVACPHVMSLHRIDNVSAWTQLLQLPQNYHSKFLVLSLYIIKKTVIDWFNCKVFVRKQKKLEFFNL